MKINEKNITFILGMSIPVLMILFVVGSIYLPSLFVKPPSINFLYSIGTDDYFCDNIQQYAVENGKLVKMQIQPIKNGDVNVDCSQPQLFVQDVVKNESRQISFEEAAELSLDANSISADGFEVVYGSRGDSYFPFVFYSSPDYETRYLKGHNISKKLNIQLNGTRYYGFQFIGWINN